MTQPQHSLLATSIVEMVARGNSIRPTWGETRLNVALCALNASDRRRASAVGCRLLTTDRTTTKRAMPWFI